MNMVSNIRILVKYNNASILKIGNVVITKNTGDIYYIPSSKYIIDSHNKSCSLEHFAWHEKGRVHRKDISGKLTIIEHGAAEQNLPNHEDGLRMKVCDIGYQEMWRDIIEEFSFLPVFSKSIKQSDIIFDIDGFIGPIIFILSIVSGKLITKQYLGEPVPIKNASQERKALLLAMENRGLGSQSNNADKMLQFQLYRFPGDISELKTKRKILIPKSSGIAKDV